MILFISPKQRCCNLDGPSLWFMSASFNGQALLFCSKIRRYIRFSHSSPRSHPGFRSPGGDGSTTDPPPRNPAPSASSGTSKRINKPPRPRSEQALKGLESQCGESYAVVSASMSFLALTWALARKACPSPASEAQEVALPNDR